MAGLLTEVYQEQFVGGHSWTVPIFLFRYHADVESYLWTFSRDADRARQIFGRFGSDFIGLSLGDDGEVVRLIAGEAKWRNRLTQSAVDTLMLGDYEDRSEEHTSELQSLMRISYAVFCLKKKHTQAGRTNSTGYGVHDLHIYHQDIG